MLYIINLQNNADTNAVATRLGVPATAKIYENVVTRFIFILFYSTIFVIKLFYYRR